MPNPIITAPYYDDYDPSKGYTTILAVPGSAEQAREFTQIQTTLYDHIGRLGDTILKNGSVVDGCVLTVSGNDAVISSGRIYMDGLVRLVDGVTLTIDGVGSEVIGVKLITTIVTEIEDPTLRDPAMGYENFGQTGAHRSKEIVQFARNNPEFTTIFRLEGGVLLKSDISPEIDVITDVLARRTYDENGNYKINGLDLRDRNEVRDGKLLISLTEGKAYIQGFEMIKPAASTVSINYSQTTRQVLNEPKGYITGIDRYLLNNQPVKEITQVKATVQKVDILTRGNVSGGIDYLSKTPVVNIVSVVAGGTTYVNGVDYQLTNDGVDWSLPGIDPSIGTTYTVTYKYNKIMVLGTDIELELFEYNHYLHFLDGDRPVTGTTVDASYNFYLARKDLVTLDKDGVANVLEGKPEIVRLSETPLNQDTTKLIIGTVLVYPNSGKMDISNFNTVRLSQSDLFRLSKRVDDIEYNQAMTDLDKEAADGEAATDLKGIFTDGFIGVTKSDLTHPEYDATIDLDNEELTLPFTIGISEMTPNTQTYETQVSSIGRIMMAPFTHLKALSQTFSTESFLVNPYAVYNPMSLISVIPAVDNWIDSTKILLNKTETKTTTLRRWWYHRGESWAEEERLKWIALGLVDGGASLGWGSSTSVVSTSSSITLDEAIMYMRQKVVKVTGQNFTPSVDNIVCRFNDTVVPLTPLAPTVAGTQAGTVRAGTQGTFTAQFTVPANTPCGSVEVKLSSATGHGTAIYRAQGRKQIITNTVLTTTIVMVPIDPLAQSFSFESDTIITRIGLYFATKDPSKAIVVQIRNMVNGYPGTTCYAETTVPSSAITVSDKGQTATLVDLNQPVYCRSNEQYCICVLSDSNVYSVFTATLGARDLITNNYVTSQPYSTGVLFSSSNALTWTAHQTQDLKFDVYKANFTSNGQVVFNDVTGLALNRLLLAAQVLDYRNAGIEWYYKVNSSSWLPIETYVDRELSSIANSISLKAVFNVADSTSPMLAVDAVNVVGFTDKTSCTYVSKNIVMDESFTKIKVLLDLTLPSGTACHVYYMNTDVSEVWNELLTPSIIPVDEEFSRYEWNKVDINAKEFRVKIVLTTTNPLARPRAKKLMNILKY